MPPIQDNGLRRVYCQIPLPFWMMIGKVFCLTSSVCDHLFGEQIVRLHTLIIEKKHPWKSTISHPKKSHHIGKTYGKNTCVQGAWIILFGYECPLKQKIGQQKKLETQQKKQKSCEWRQGQVAKTSAEALPSKVSMHALTKGPKNSTGTL